MKGCVVMYALFGFLAMIATIMMIVALIKPKWGTFGKRPEWNRKKAAGLWLAACIVLSGLASATTPPEVKQAQQQKAAQQKMEEEAKKHVFAKNYGFTMEQTKALDEALESVGIKKIKDATKQGAHDYVLEVDAGSYTPDKNTIHVFCDENNKLLAIKYRAIALWNDGKPVHQISDYIMSTSEELTVTRKSKEMVKKVLKAPKSANFDSGTFKYYKSQGVITLIGTVDAQNSFGAMIRSQFKTQFKEEDGSLKPIHFTFEGNQLL